MIYAVYQMREVILRDFLKNYKDYIPLPEEGIRIVCRDFDDFYVSPVPPKSNTEKLQGIAKFLARELQQNGWEIVQRPLAQKPAQPALSTPPPVSNTAPLKFCEAKTLLPWESPCKQPGTEFVAVASLKDGQPMTDDDWKELYLCPVHRKLVEKLGEFDVEDA